MDSNDSEGAMFRGSGPGDLFKRQGTRFPLIA